MNLYDAELIKSIMIDHNYTITPDEKKADILLLVTCSVRKHAETRALGRLSALRGLKQSNPDRVLVVTGCMAQKFKERLAAWGADLIVGPDQYRQIPHLISTYQSSRITQTCTEFSLESYAGITPKMNGKVTAFVAIMRGCNNFCRYCIVPYVRGQERSKPIKDLYPEISDLALVGIKEITLVGQNVLVYNDEGVNFIELVEQVEAIPGIERIRFITSHPRDLNLDLLERLSRLKKFCPALHLPLQSGSNRILELMNRGYTKEHYLRLIQAARELIADVSITTDFIVGFPSETDEDFNETLEVVDRVGFDFAYMFKYSPREGTEAAAMENDVPEPLKQQRLSRLLERQNRITKHRNQELLGTTVSVLIESKNRRDLTFIGRTKNNKIVVIKEPVQIGQTVSAEITALDGWTLIGEVKGGLA